MPYKMMLLFTLHLTVSTIFLRIPSVYSQTVHSSPQASPSAVLVIGQQDTEDVNFCSGTLVAPQWVLTARSCLYHNAIRLRRFHVYAGGEAYQEYATKTYLPNSQLHRSYHSFINTKYDLALLKTQGMFKQNDYVRVVPRIDEQVHTESFATYSCDVTGFGVLNSTNSEVRRIKDKVLVYVPCFRRVGWSFDYWTWQRQKDLYGCTYRTIRTYPECAASTGAGLICEGKLVGVAHVIVTDTNKKWLYEPVRGNPCRDYSTTSVFSLVAPHRSWILQTMRPDRFKYEFQCNTSGIGLSKMYSLVAVIFGYIVIIF
ncbi:granzyme M-like [Macrosteles quadrilineatus]|uniref:granzyme M-like n=1 Tax=Macrosteles quadrilineatus TaxID=74068 RepID=UPI0023E15FF6|nr:granzyme M-like [Macrosteles quadrilineatus]